MQGIGQHTDCKGANLTFVAIGSSDFFIFRMILIY